MKPVRLDLLALQGLKGTQDLGVCKVSRDRKDLVEKSVLRGLKDLRVLRETPETLALPVLGDLKEKRVTLEPLAQQARPAPRARKETPVQLDLRDHREKRGTPLPTMILPRLSC